MAKRRESPRRSEGAAKERLRELEGEIADKGGGGRRRLGWFREPVDPLTSLILVTPVFLIYHLGILFIPLRNGVDLVTGLMTSLLHLSRLGYVGLTLAIGAGMLLAGRELKKRGRAHVFSFGRVLAESAVLAVVMLLTVGWATATVLPNAALSNQIAAQIGPHRMGLVEKLVMAAGAGFHEELFFRVGLFGGLMKLLHRLPRFAGFKGVAVAAIVAALAFSAVHYVGALGDTFSVGSFVFRFFSGLYLTLVFRTRGFAVAVYTHALYDVGVFFGFFG